MFLIVKVFKQDRYNVHDTHINQVYEKTGFQTENYYFEKVVQL